MVTSTENLCVACGRPQPDAAYACASCSGKAAGQLDTIVDMTPAARDIAHGQARHGSGGGGSDEGRLPLNLGATQRLDEVQNTLTTLVRHILWSRGGTWPGGAADPIVLAAQWLSGPGGHLEWLRHRQEVDEALADIAACARIVAGIARGPAAQKYLGPCGAEISTGTLAEPELTMECDGDTYAREGASTGRCRSCGAEVSTAERQAWLDDQTRGRAYRASEIEDAYGIKANLIRQWATPARGILTVHGHDRLGRALYLLGDVLDVARARAAQRASEQAKRARRAAAREDEAAREAAEMGA